MSTPLHLELADEAGLVWAQEAVTRHHYLHSPVDSRCSVLGYIVKLGAVEVGCLLFGRPEATACYQGGLTYGGSAARAEGRARYDRWEVLNLARVWLDPRVQAGGHRYVPNAATWAIGQALGRVVVDYLVRFPVVWPDEPWRLRVCLSYCDTRRHQGTIYRAAGFQLARTNEDGIETWYRPLRGLQGHERKQILKVSEQSPRSRRYRSARAAQAEQAAFL